MLLDAGFVFNEVGVGSSPVTAPLVRDAGWARLARLLLRRGAERASQTGASTTTVLYEADAEEFAAAFPRSEERPEGPDCKDLWLYYDASTTSIELDLQGEEVGLRDAASSVSDASRPLEDRVVALTRAVERFFAERRASS